MDTSWRCWRWSNTCASCPSTNARMTADHSSCSTATPRNESWECIAPSEHGIFWLFGTAWSLSWWLLDTVIIRSSSKPKGVWLLPAKRRRKRKKLFRKIPLQMCHNVDNECILGCIFLTKSEFFKAFLLYTPPNREFIFHCKLQFSSSIVFQKVSWKH